MYTVFSMAAGRGAICCMPINDHLPINMADAMDDVPASHSPIDMNCNWVDIIPHHLEAPITLYSTALLYNLHISDFTAAQRGDGDR